MTFYEAALQVLEGAGHPLHFQEITERSIAENLLSHVGKTPEQTMLARLAAMAKRKGDRRVKVTAKDTFALAEWTVPEDPEALAVTGLVEPHPEEGLPPLRPVERHPEVRRENVRASGRGADRKRRRDEDEDRGGRRRRYPPVPEVAFDLLSEAMDPLTPEAMLEQGRELGLMSKELSVEALLTSLLEDNQRRIDAGRRPQFLYGAESGHVALERAGAPSDAPSLELQAAFAAALGIPLEGGRPVFSRPAEAVSEQESPIEQARAALRETHRTMARALRQRLQALEAGTFERATFKLLHGHDFRELKVAKRSKDGPLITARRKEGSVELRFAIRVHRAGQVDRKVVQELRRDLNHYNAQVGLVLSPGDVRGDARGEAQSSGALVMLWCGEALAEKFLAAGTGVKVVRFELFEADEAFFAQMQQEAEEASRRREERKKDRAGERGEVQAAPEKSTAARDVDLDAATAFVGGTEEESAEASASEGSAEEGEDRRRRRRRRRGRRGRGSKDEGTSAEGGEAAAASDTSQSEGGEEGGGLDVDVEVDVSEVAEAEGVSPEAVADQDDDVLQVSDEDIFEVTGPTSVDALMAQAGAGAPAESAPTTDALQAEVAADGVANADEEASLAATAPVASEALSANGSDAAASDEAPGEDASDEDGPTRDG